MERLAGKVAVVTGGAKGIGRAACVRLAEEGAHVAVTDVDEAAGSEVVDAILDSGGEAAFWRLDVANASHVERVFNEIGDRWGKIDVLINNAGIAGANKPTD